MATHHEPLKALGPIQWDDVPKHELKNFLNSAFTDAQIVIDSIPSPSTDSSPTARSRAQTDPAAAIGHVSSSASPSSPPASIPNFPSPASIEQTKKLRDEWKEVKLNAKDNPLDMKVYKLAGKDGKGAWFARRSVHHGGLSFERWKQGMEKEFAESMKIQGDPGSGNIRGIGADKRVEDIAVPEAGKLEVFQLSAQFPGPTAPRDFVTLLLTSDFSHLSSHETSAPRQYMIVSKPCVHSDCPPRQGIIRGQYESVEIIREVPRESAAPKRSLSSVDLAKSNDSVSLSAEVGSPDDNLRNDASSETTTRGSLAIEWLMVTRSDPGGSVPRFLIEKGTPPGIVGDAGKFLEWISSMSGDNEMGTVDDGLAREKSRESGLATNDKALADQSVEPNDPGEAGNNIDDQEMPSSSGLYGMITGAFGTASSVVAGGLRRQFTGDQGNDSRSSSDNEPSAHNDGGHSSPSETSSVRSFASALDKTLSQDKEGDSMHSELSKEQSEQPLEKELKRLEEKRRKIDEKSAKMQERMEQKRQSEKDKDSAAAAKAHEKHQKEIAKQEARYKRELQKLEDKRQQEIKKAEERRRKMIEREEKSSLSLELEKTRVDKEVALKQVEALEKRVRELQAQNTTLAAKLEQLGHLGESEAAASSSLAKTDDNGVSVKPQ